MDTLPEEVLIYIFEFFDMKSRLPLFQVCRRWSNIILNTPRLNSTLGLYERYDIDFLRLWPRSSNIKKLVIDVEVALMNTMLEELGHICPNLRSLTISRSNLLSERHVHRLSKCFPLLECIDICLTTFYVPSWYLNILGNMKCVVLNNRMDDCTLKVIAEKCTKLKELHMYGYVKFYPLCHLQNVLTLRYQTLTKLTLRCCELNDKTCVLLANCTNLSNLYMYSCWLITDTGLSHLSTLKYLSALHLTGLKLTTIKGFDNFLKSLKMDAITELNFSSTAFSDSHALLLGNKKMFLQTLELWNCPKLTDKGINHLLDKFKELIILDINITLTEETLERIVLDTVILFLRFDTANLDFLKMFKLLRNRKVSVDGVTSCTDELHFRGTSEGFRANLMSYKSQFQFGL